MYLSHLMIDVGSDPDRPRPGRLWLRNLYHVHQRLSMAFPSREQLAGDPQFLRPYDPAGFRRPHFLFRIDNVIEAESPCVVILVQSEIKPDWDYAFGLTPGLIDPRTHRPIGNADYLLAAPPTTRVYQPVFEPGGLYRFRIRVNPAKRNMKSRDGSNRRTMKSRTSEHVSPPQAVQGKRVALIWKGEEENQTPEDVIIPWLAKKGWIRLEERKEPVQAFKLHACNIVNLGRVTASRVSAPKMTFFSALIEGRLEVIDAGAFARVVEKGLGPAKAFGFGLLSVVRD